MKYPIVLTIAGSDPSGGAGIQADIKAISATGSYAASAVTSVTVQNTVGVSAVHDIPVDIVRGEIKAVLDDIGADAVKIGMLSNSALVRSVAESVEAYGITNVVLDPVMVATSGDKLLAEDAVRVLSGELAPLVRVITPNIPEAEVLSGKKISSQEDLSAIAVELSSMLSRRERKVSVLLKAGHMAGKKLIDCFYNAEEDHVIMLPSQRVFTVNTHGTGCSLSSALASYLAQGYALDFSVAKAKDYMIGAIESGSKYEIGHGHGPVDHFWNCR